MPGQEWHDGERREREAPIWPHDLYTFEWLWRQPTAAEIASAECRPFQVSDANADVLQWGLPLD